jgi:hypothetical protein
MDRLWALKNDLDPLGGRFPGFPLSIVRSTVYRCPYCRWVFKVTWGPSNTLLGTGERTCWHCRMIFRDGSSEWPEMNNSDRQRFVLPITITGFLGSFLLILGLMLWASLVLKDSGNFEYRLFFYIFGIPLVLWFSFRAWQIHRSVHRYNSRGKSQPI